MMVMEMTKEKKDTQHRAMVIKTDLCDDQVHINMRMYVWKEGNFHSRSK